MITEKAMLGILGMNPIYPHAFAGINGLDLVANEYIPEFTIYMKQFRFPKSKAKRIRKKWSKNWDNFKSVQATNDVIYKMGNALIVHPKLIGKLKAALEACVAVQP